MSGPRIIDCAQNSEEWFRARMGMPTASEFSTILAKGKGGAESKTRRTYMLKLAGEILTEEPSEGFSNAHTERGHEMEPEARDLYAFATNTELQEVGFIVNGKVGCSPDRLIGTNGGLEIKTKLPHLLIPLLIADEFPSDHKAQVQGCLWVAEREWWDIAVFWPKLPLFVKRATRDEPYIKTLSDAVDAFTDELAETVEKVRRYGLAEVREAA